MTRRDGSELIPLSALQHFLYCPRQCALIHLDGLWAENELTVEGNQLHETINAEIGNTRGGVRLARGLPLRSISLGVVGRADVVEFPSVGPPRPIEFKRGKPKLIDADKVQLCAQALCLEEMLAVAIRDGELFYGRTRRRERVEFSSPLRDKTIATVGDVRAMLDSGVTPRVAYHKRLCDRCSLKNLCLPRGTGPSRSPSRYLDRALTLSLADK